MGCETHSTALQLHSQPPPPPPPPSSLPPPTALAPGFRFHPTDEELVSYYLKRKVSNRPVRFNAIAEVDIYKIEPWELADKSRLRTRDQEWYFFSVLDKKYGNGGRMNRATGHGYWKATGKDREIRRDSQLIAMKKTLVFHSGRAPGGQRTNWVMHEYRLVDDESYRAAANQFDYVLCRVFHKTNIGPPNGNRYAPFMEEEWDDIISVLVPGEDVLDEAGHEISVGLNHVEQDTHSINRKQVNANGLPGETQNILTLCKTERDEDCRPVCVLNTEAPFPLLQYKRRRQNNDRGSSSDASENSMKTAQKPCSSVITTAATKTGLTNAATATAVSALLEFSLMESIEPEKTPPPPPAPQPKFDAAAYLGSAVPPGCVKLINDLQSEIHKISVEKEALRLEMMSAQAMINILQYRIDYLNKENEDLKSSSRESK